MAYDCAAVQMHGPDWPKRNFPGELITKPPESRGEEQRRLKAARKVKPGVKVTMLCLCQPHCHHLACVALGPHASHAASALARTEPSAG
jgi:hypothetical protein